MKNYKPISSTADDKVTLADVIESYFDVIRAAIPTEENPLKAEITYTDQQGNDFNINLKITAKSQE